MPESLFAGYFPGQKISVLTVARRLRQQPLPRCPRARLQLPPAPPPPVASTPPLSPGAVRARSAIATATLQIERRPPPPDARSEPPGSAESRHCGREPPTVPPQVPSRPLRPAHTPTRRGSAA